MSTEQLREIDVSVIEFIEDLDFNTASAILAILGKEYERSIRFTERLIARELKEERDQAVHVALPPGENARIGTLEAAHRERIEALEKDLEETSGALRRSHERADLLASQSLQLHDEHESLKQEVERLHAELKTAKAAVRHVFSVPAEPASTHDLPSSSVDAAVEENAAPKLTGDASEDPKELTGATVKTEKKYSKHYSAKPIKSQQTEGIFEHVCQYRKCGKKFRSNRKNQRFCTSLHSRREWTYIVYEKKKEKQNVKQQAKTHQQIRTDSPSVGQSRTAEEDRREPSDGSGLSRESRDEESRIVQPAGNREASKSSQSRADGTQPADGRADNDRGQDGREVQDREAGAQTDQRVEKDGFTRYVCEECKGFVMLPVAYPYEKLHVFCKEKRDKREAPAAKEKKSATDAPRLCERCEKVSLAGRPQKTKFCPGCRKEIDLAKAREYAADRRRKISSIPDIVKQNPPEPEREEGDSEENLSDYWRAKQTEKAAEIEAKLAQGQPSVKFRCEKCRNIVMLPQGSKPPHYHPWCRKDKAEPGKKPGWQALSAASKGD